MNDFAYARAASAAEAIQLATGTSAAYMAGSTELLNWMRLGISEPRHVVDIARLAELRGVKADASGLWIGSMTTLAEIEADLMVRRAAPVLSESCLRAASPQIRNRATLGGNVLQKTRCAYFRAEHPVPWPCNKRTPGSGCAALDGSNERHAIFGWTDTCVATQPSDPVVALACLDAQVELAGPRGKRTVPVQELLLSQSEAAKVAAPRAADASLESSLRPGELILGYRVPFAGAARSAYVKVRERESYEYALVSAAATVELDDGRYRSVRIALGSVAQRPWRLESAERALVGKTSARETITTAIASAMRDARPLRHNAYKVTLATNAAVRAVETAGRVA